jgi:hypothetical protein
MHEIEPYYNWLKYYDASTDERSPFYGIDLEDESDGAYFHTIYGYYIHPDWDYIGTETLYLKLQYVDYKRQFAVLEMMGEWNDTLHNDIMYLKRHVIDILNQEGIIHYILIGENILNFHGGDDDYYSEWFDDVESGWIAFINFRDFVQNEMTKYRVDNYINYGGTLDSINWRTLDPIQLFTLIESLITRRLNA